MKQLQLKGKRVVLRLLKMQDADMIARHLKNKEIKKYTTAIPHPYTRKDAIIFLKKSAKQSKKGEIVHFAIIQNNQLIGGIGLEKISKENKNAELGYWLSEDEWGKGIMTESVKLILQYAFNKLKLHKVYACAFEENIGSRKVLEKCGFSLEAVIKDQRFRFKKWHNEVRYGIISKP